MCIVDVSPYAPGAILSLGALANKSVCIMIVNNHPFHPFIQSMCAYSASRCVKDASQAHLVVSRSIFRAEVVLVPFKDAD